MGRSYSDESYSAKQVVAMPATGALNGTAAAAADLSRMSFMQPVTVTDANVTFTAGGTNSTTGIIIGKSAAGTGAVSAIGTIMTGTSGTLDTKEGAVTATDFETGDDLVIQRTLGTSTTVENMIPYIQYRENFVVSDS